MAFKVMNITSILSAITGTGSGTENEIILPVTFAADGISTYVLPARCDINKIVLVTTANIIFRLGITGNEELLIPNTNFIAGQTEKFLSLPFLPNSITIEVHGITAGNVAGFIYYQIVP